MDHLKWRAIRDWTPDQTQQNCINLKEGEIYQIIRVNSCVNFSNLIENSLNFLYGNYLCLTVCREMGQDGGMFLIKMVIKDGYHLNIYKT